MMMVFSFQLMNGLSKSTGVIPVVSNLYITLQFPVPRHLYGSPCHIHGPTTMEGLKSSQVPKQGKVPIRLKRTRLSHQGQ